MIVIHCQPNIPWHGPFAERMFRGLQKLDLDVDITSSQQRLGGNVTPVLLGTTCWRSIEASGSYLLVDRCSFGDSERWVSLVWNGHGRRGDHRVPHDVDGERWERIGVEVKPWRRRRLFGGAKRVLCGQTETYSPHFESIGDWYAAVKGGCTHFRPHPALKPNLCNIPLAHTWEDVDQVVTLNSSVAVQAILEGIPTEVHDEGGMAYPGFPRGADRMPWLHWLAWTQWSHDEIEAGEPIAHLFS